MAVRPLQEVCCSLGVKKKSGEKGEQNTCVLLVKMKTWRNRKKVNDELQLYK